MVSGPCDELAACPASRLLMVALMLASPSPARAADAEASSARQRDRAAVQGHFEAADPGGRARPGQRQGGAAQRPGDQRLRRRRPDRLHPLRAADGGGQRQPGAGRRSRTSSAMSPAATSIRMNEGASAATKISIVSLVLAARRSPRAPPTPAWASSPPASGRRWAVPGLHPRPGSSADLAGAAISRRPGSAARAGWSSSRSCRTRNIASPSMPRTVTTAPTRCPGAHRRSRTAITRIRPGTRRSTRRSKRASSGSRPSCRAISTRSWRSMKYPESDQTVPAHYARAYAYHLGAYPDKAHGRGRHIARHGAGRPVLPRAEGPDPARIRASRRKPSRCCAKRSRTHPTSR